MVKTGVLWRNWGVVAPAMQQHRATSILAWKWRDVGSPLGNHWNRNGQGPKATLITMVPILETSSPLPSQRKSIPHRSEL